MFCRPSALRIFVVLALVPVAYGREASGSDVENRLRDQYRGKMLILRGFYSGDILKYDSVGNPIGSLSTDDWTLSGVVRIEDLYVSDGRLTIEGSRARMASVGGDLQEVHGRATKPGRDESTDRALQIDADLSSETEDAFEGVLSRIFLTDRDHFVELVPDYWKPCVAAAVTLKYDRWYADCRFSKKFRAVPGVSAVGTGVGTAQGGAPQAGASFRLGNGVKPPTFVSRHTPEPSEDAKRAKYQGTVVLDMVVGENGDVRDVHIMKPLGMGLDKKAVEAVNQWRFRPGTKDGRPVSVKIAVEVDFHLY